MILKKLPQRNLRQLLYFVIGLYNTNTVLADGGLDG